MFSFLTETFWKTLTMYHCRALFIFLSGRRQGDIVPQISLCWSLHIFTGSSPDHCLALSVSKIFFDNKVKKVNGDISCQFYAFIIYSLLSWNFYWYIVCYFLCFTFLCSSPQKRHKILHDNLDCLNDAKAKPQSHRSSHLTFYMLWLHFDELVANMNVNSLLWKWSRE